MIFNRIAMWFYKDHALANTIQPGSDVDIKMSINGTEVDPSKFMQRIHESYDKDVQQQAKLFIKTQSEKLYELANHVESLTWVLEDLNADDILDKDKKIKELEAELQTLKNTNSDTTSFINANVLVIPIKLVNKQTNQVVMKLAGNFEAVIARSNEEGITVLGTHIYNAISNVASLNDQMDDIEFQFNVNPIHQKSNTICRTWAAHSCYQFKMLKDFKP